MLARVPGWWGGRTAEICLPAPRFGGRPVASIQLASEAGDLEDAYWLPGAEKPADGLTTVRSDVAPISRLLESGRFRSGLVVAPSKGCGLVGVSGTCDALEFVAHAHIRECSARGPTLLKLPALFGFFSHCLFFVRSSEGRGGSFWATPHVQ